MKMKTHSLLMAPRCRKWNSYSRIHSLNALRDVPAELLDTDTCDQTTVPATDTAASTVKHVINDSAAGEQLAETKAAAMFAFHYFFNFYALLFTLQVFCIL